MSKQNIPRTLGTVTEALPNTMFRVVIIDENREEKEVLGHLSGKMRLNRIRVLIGDRVELELDQYGGNTNRIVKRL
ncbi:MAG: translation initiation factor IF-1 [bacterium]